MLSLGNAFNLPKVIDGIFTSSAGGFGRNQVGNESQIPNPISGARTLQANPALEANYNSSGNILERTASTATGAMSDPLFGHVNQGTANTREEQLQLQGTLQIPTKMAQILARPTSRNNFSQDNLFSSSSSSSHSGGGGGGLPRAPGGGVAPRGPAGTGGAVIALGGSGGGGKKGRKGGGAAAGRAGAPDRNGNRGVTDHAVDLKTNRAGERSAADLMSGQARRVAFSADRVNKNPHKRKNRMSSPRSGTRRKYSCTGACGGGCTSCKKRKNKRR